MNTFPQKLNGKIKLYAQTLEMFSAGESTATQNEFCCAFAVKFIALDVSNIFADLVFGLKRPVGTSGLKMYSKNNAVRFRQLHKVSIVQNTIIGERNAEDRITA